MSDIAWALYQGNKARMCRSSQSPRRPPPQLSPAKIVKSRGEKVLPTICNHRQFSHGLEYESSVWLVPKPPPENF